MVSAFRSLKAILCRCVPALLCAALGTPLVSSGAQQLKLPHLRPAPLSRLSFVVRLTDGFAMKRSGANSRTSRAPPLASGPQVLPASAKLTRMTLGVGNSGRGTRGAALSSMDCFVLVLLLQGRRFFLEPVDWASATWLPERDHGIDWQRRLSKDEPWLEYASRIQSMSLPLGFACGSSQLGVRKIGFTSPSLRFWRIKGVPLAWDSSELASHLAAAGFSRVDVDNRSSGGRYASWTFRAVCDDAVDSLKGPH